MCTKRTTITRRTRTALVVAAGITVAGCSSEPVPEPTPTAGAASVVLSVDPERAGMPEPTNRPDRVAGDVARAAQERSCEAFAPLVLTEVRPTTSDPVAGGPARPEECPALAPYVDALTGIAYSHIEQYGVTALAWGQAPDERSATLLLVADTDGAFRLAGAYPKTQDYTETAQGDEAQAAVGTFLSAAQDQNCDDLQQAVTPASPLYQADPNPQVLCDQIQGSGWRTEMSQQIPTNLHVLGETDFVGLYGVPIGEVYLVVQVIQNQESGRYAVQDVHTLLL